MRALQRFLKVLPAAMGVAALLSALAASPAAAATAPVAGANLAGTGGCKVDATSTDKDGKTLSSVAAPGGGGASQDHPFIVSSSGNVHWDASSTVALKNHKWHVEVYGATIMSGGDPNDKGEQKASGDANPGKVLSGLPFKVVGLFPVSGAITSDTGACSGNAWAKLEGEPAGSGFFDIGLILALAGVAGLVWSLPNRRQGVNV